MRSPFYTAGAWCWIITGAVHDLLDVATRISPPRSEEPLNDLLRALPFDMLGMGRSYYEVTMGISLGMGISMMVVGGLFLFVSRVASEANHLRQASGIGVATSLVMLAVAGSLEPLPPIALFGAASLCFAVSLSAGRRSTTTVEPGTPSRVRA